jgi:hypothetical protein
MNLRERIRSWLQPIYFLGQNTLTLTGAVITTSTALTTIAFWFYEIFLPAPPHPYIGILFFLIFPGIFVLGLLLIPLGIWLRRQTLRARGKLPRTFPAIDLHGAAHLQVGGLGDRAQSSHYFDRIVPWRGVHGYDEFLRDDLSHRNGARIYGVSEFSALAGAVRRLPHRTRSRLVCAIKGFRSAAGFRSGVPQLSAPHPFSGAEPAPGPSHL